MSQLQSLHACTYAVNGERWLLIAAADDLGTIAAPEFAVDVSYVPQYWSWA